MKALYCRIALVLLISLHAVLACAANNYTALWWNPGEPGWGLNINHQGNLVFATLFTYDASGQSMWLVMSSGQRQGTAERFSGDLYQTTGPRFDAIPFTPIGAANVTRVGSMSLTFDDANSGTLAYDVSGRSVSKRIQMQVYGSGPASCDTTTGSRASATNYQDLWFNASESGWGLNVTHQDQTIFATLFTYGTSGQGLWLVMSAGTLQSDRSYVGELYQTTGPPFDSARWSAVTVTRVGTMKLQFANGTAGTLDYSVNGVSVRKSITRQEFSSPRPVCAMASVTLPPTSGGKGCGVVWVKGRTLTIESRFVIGTTEYVSQLTRSFGADGTFQGQPAQQVIDRTTTGTNTHSIQELATEVILLGYVTVTQGVNQTSVYVPAIHTPKDWTVGQTTTYTGQTQVSGSPGPMSVQQMQTLTGFENVTVPAGTFSTCVFRIQTRATFQGQTSDSQTDMWIAPGIGEVKQVAKDSGGQTVFTTSLQRVQ